MSANKRSSLMLLSLSLAVACLLGVFAFIDASSANASQGEVPPPASNLNPEIIISPTVLQATLQPNEILTQTLWITNTGDSDLSFTIYEMTATLPLAGFTLQPVAVPLIEPQLEEQVSAQGSAEAIIYLREVPDLSPAYKISDRIGRVKYVYHRLLETASHSQELFEWLEEQGAQPSRLLTANAIAATLNAAQLSQLVENPQVRQISSNHQYAIIQPDPTTPEGPQLPILPAHQPGAVEWNIAKIRADDAWSTFGVTGEGAVIGIMDTGVMFNHPALVNSYRGKLGDGNFDHNYNWFDLVNGDLIPYDDHGHGSMITGIVSGDDGAGNQIGVAPGADWIAVKVCSVGGVCDEFDVHTAFQWMMAPTDLNSENPDPTKAPQVVFGGWGSIGCDNTFENDIMVLRAAGILPIFSTGGGGGECNTMGSPADLPDVLAAGATDQNDLIAPFSPRGPSCYSGGIKPDVSAPGVEIRSRFNNGGYVTWSGTAESAAHAAGVAALIISANSSVGTDELLGILYSTALCIDNSQCGGSACPGANNVYGHGRIDAYKAVLAALGNPPEAELPWLDEAPLSGTIHAGEGTAVTIAYDSNGLENGIYTGALGILSNDPNQPFTSVPVTMDVINPGAPILVIDPLSLSASLAVDGVQTDTLTISNEGNAALTFSLSEISTTLRLESNPVQLSILDRYPADVPARADGDARRQLLFFNQSRLIIYLRGQIDFSDAYRIEDRTERVQYVYDQLLQTAAQSDDLYNWLLSQGTQPRRLLTANAIAATLNATQLETVLSFQQVARVEINKKAEIIQAEPAAWNWLQSPLNMPGVVDWNIAKIRADQVWTDFGIRGEGAVVGEIDTGVAFTHPALNTQYRGNQGGGNFDHNYSWFDFVEGNPVPYDDVGHGTFGMGIVVGDGGGINQIGVAPGAQWIAVKALDAGGVGTYETLHAALQWMLAPTDLEDLNPTPAMAPQVVLSMWGVPSYLCDHTFEADLVALRAANILPVFAPGAEEPACANMTAPAIDPNAVTAGATDSNDNLAQFSPSGPSCFDGSIKPDVVAPGVNIRSSLPDGSYDIWSGTSFSTAHLAGAAALLFSADPNISLDQLEQTLFDSAVCREQLECGGDPCPGPNNSYGYGRIDVFEAVSATISLPYDISWLVEMPITGTVNPGESTIISVIFDASGMQPGTYTGGISIESNDPDTPNITLPVTLTVSASCQPITGLNAAFTPLEPAVGEVITFTASAIGTLPIVYSWDFANGSPLYGPVVTYTFDTPGPHFVGLTAENACDIETVDYALPVDGVLQSILLPIITR